MASAALWQPEVQISWQAQPFVPMRGQVQISTDFVAGSAPFATSGDRQIGRWIDNIDR